MEVLAASEASQALTQQLKKSPQERELTDSTASGLRGEGAFCGLKAYPRRKRFLKGITEGIS